MIFQRYSKQRYTRRLQCFNDFVDTVDPSIVTEDNNNIQNSSPRIDSAANNSKRYGYTSKKKTLNGYISQKLAKHAETSITIPTIKLNVSNPTNKPISSIYAEVWNNGTTPEGSVVIDLKKVTISRLER